MTDHPITRSTDSPILTSLQSFILRTIHRHGPQSDMGLWHNSAKHESLKAIIVAVGILADENFIERTPTHKIPQRYSVPTGSPRGSMQWWQLTQKGQQHIAALGAADAACNAAQQQEVTPWI
jgi:hypothetical protein